MLTSRPRCQAGGFFLAGDGWNVKHQPPQPSRDAAIRAGAFRLLHCAGYETYRPPAIAAEMTSEGAKMIRVAMALLLLTLTGCVEPMPLHDEDNKLLNQSAQHLTDGPAPWRPRTLFEQPAAVPPAQ